MILCPVSIVSRQTRRRDDSFLLASAGRFLGMQADQIARITNILNNGLCSGLLFRGFYGTDEEA